MHLTDYRVNNTQTQHFMAEFITMQEAEDKFGKKGRTNAALTLGIIGTGLAALSGNNCGNNGGILGGLFGNNNYSLAERAMQMAQAQGQQADNLACSHFLFLPLCLLKVAISCLAKLLTWHNRAFGPGQQLPRSKPKAGEWF